MILVLEFFRLAHSPGNGTFSREGPSAPCRRVETSQYQDLVDAHYRALYRFAMSLAGDEATAWDLTQETFLRWSKKGHQLRDVGKAKTWLFTTLYREFLAGRRRQSRFVAEDVNAIAQTTVEFGADAVVPLDGSAVLDALARVREEYRAALALFYLQSHSYREIAEILKVPIGTVMSRLSRGKSELRHLLADTAEPNPGGKP